MLVEEDCGRLHRKVFHRKLRERFYHYFFAVCGFFFKFTQKNIEREQLSDRKLFRAAVLTLWLEVGKQGKLQDYVAVDFVTLLLYKCIRVTK